MWKGSQSSWPYVEFYFAGKGFYVNIDEISTRDILQINSLSNLMIGNIRLLMTVMNTQ